MSDDLHELVDILGLHSASVLMALDILITVSELGERPTDELINYLTVILTEAFESGSKNSRRSA